MSFKSHFNGYFNDLPYIGPVESSAFYQLVSAARLHKLSEALILNPREISYFVDSGSRLYSVIKLSHEQSLLKGIKGTPYPELKTNNFSIDSFNASSERKLFHIKESVSRTYKTNNEPNAVNIIGLDFYGVQKIWSDLIVFMFGCGQATNLHFVVPNLDNYLQDESGIGEFVLSFLVIGVASIINFFISKELNLEKIEKFLLEFTVCSNDRGRCIADALQFFLENTLHLSVSRSFCSPAERFTFHQRLLEGITSIEVSSFNELMESVRFQCVDRHEELCDFKISEDESAALTPIILLIVPSLNSVRYNLKKSLLDSYSYEPITVLSDIDWDASMLERKKPIIFFCSSAWVSQQARCPKYEQLLCKLDIKTVLHCGFIESGLTIEEELMETITFIKYLNQSSFNVLFMKHSPQSFAGSFACPCGINPFEVAGSVVLLTFRLFMMKFSPVSKQPFFTLPRNVLFTERAWRLYLECVSRLLLSGLIKTTCNYSDWPTIELTVIGRLLSFRFRLVESGTEGPELSLIDSKIVVWSHLLRQRFSDTCNLIQERYIFKDWVACNVKKFCDIYNLIFTENNTSSFLALIRQLSNFGINDLSDGKRAHIILSSPYGRRIPIQLQLSDQSIATCRGWFEQAPLQIGLAMGEESVDTFCLPPSSLYCEIEVALKDSVFRIQCPTEVSYPIIIVYFILHISLHNNGIFVESLNAVPPVPLPVSVLQSHTMLSILENTELINAGLWLDGVMCDAVLAPSDPSMLANLLMKAQHLINMCERAPFTRKKKFHKTEPKDSVDKGTSRTFTGSTPKSASEADTIEEFISLINTIGREKAESTFKGKKGFKFLDSNHYLYPYYIHLLTKGV